MKKEFKAESKRLLDLMINSIYTHREIFLRELISNASDAIDKLYYKALTDPELSFDSSSYQITVSADKEARTITISDTGIGMTEAELEENLGVIAQSGSLHFKKETQIEEDHEIIGQFGVGFYSAFLVADQVTVRSKAVGSDQAFCWHSEGVDGYTVEACHKDTPGTEITLKVKDNTEDESFDEFLETYRLQGIIKKYSDFIRYPIKMEVARQQLREGSEDEFEEVLETETVNSMVPVWKKNKRELTDEDYKNFYHEKHFGFDEPLSHIHLSVDGNVSYDAILYIPESTPFDFYTPDFKKGLELYSSGVLIMNKCEELLPDYFSFVKGIVDSEDLSLNISREILQHDRQLKLIAKNIKTKVKNELEKMLKNDREKYEKFFASFGRQIKFGLYADYGANKDDLKNLVLFTSSHADKLVSLHEYVSRMPEGQEHIYYAVGSDVSRIKKMPQTEAVLDKGFEILYFTEEIDEFAIRILGSYEEKEFKSVSSADLSLDKEKDDEINASFADVFEEMTEKLSGKVKSVRATSRLKSHPVALTNEGDISIEMEKTLNAMPNGGGVQAEKILEVNVDHQVFKALQEAREHDQDKFSLFTEVLYGQARLMEGLELEDPIAFANNICLLMK